MSERELLSFARPAAYLGNEWNLKFSAPASGDLRICLCFPEAYGLGMSNLGFRIVHNLLGAQAGVSCERCFLPGKDLEEHLFKTNTALFSLETKTPLKDFDLVAFSLNYELSFINFLKMLKLGGIGIERASRRKPLVLVGGLTNPEPLERFVDLFFLGEFEEAASSFIKALVSSRALSKEDKLLSLLNTPGVYIPDFYYLDKDGLKPKDKRAPFPIKRVYLKDLNKNFYPDQWIVPYVPIVFDRLQVEVQRGCPHSCKFCQARCIYYPYRERKAELVADKIFSFYEQTGYEAVSLLGLSVIDYSGLEQVLKEVIPYLSKQRVSLSIPSLKPNPGAVKIIEALQFAKRPGITIAIEAANKALRDSLGKKIDMEDVRGLIKAAAGLGYRQLKFYFMIGLAGETDQDAVSIGDLLEELSFIYKTSRGHFPNIVCTVSYFVPKSFSDFEDLSLQEHSTFERRKKLLRERLSRLRFIKLNFSDFRNSYLDCLLSRADRSISVLIEDIFHKTLNDEAGYLNIDLWQETAGERNLDLDKFLKTNQTLPRHIAIDGR